MNAFDNVDAALLTRRSCPASIPTVKNEGDRLARRQRQLDRQRGIRMNPYVIPWMDEDLEVFRDTVVRFIDTDMVPHDARWRDQHHVDRETWRKAGDTRTPPVGRAHRYGGGGGDFRHEAVLYTELARRGICGFGQGVHSICAHYVLNHGTEDQKRGSCRAWRRRAHRRHRHDRTRHGFRFEGNSHTRAKQGDHYVVDGCKIFITNGFFAGLCCSW